MSEKVELPYPTTPTEIGEHTVSFITSGVAAGGTAEVQADQVKIIEDAGWTVDGPYDGEFTPSLQGTLIEQAVLRGVDGIILYSIPPETVPAAVKSAQEAGIPIVCSFCQPTQPTEGVTLIGETAESLVTPQIPVILADLNKDDATIVVVRFENNTVEANTSEQIRLIEEQCPDCKVETIVFSVSDLGKPTVPAYVNMLREYPEGELDAVIAPFNPAATSLINTAEQAGRDDFRIHVTFGDAEIGQQIESGEHAPLLAGSVIESPIFKGYAIVDALARVFNDQEVPDYSNLPGAPIMQQNAGEYLNDDGRWETDEMKAKFYEQWGLSD
ncbi:sugar ABC transporter substrate-binding protein [Nocardioides immobilis]|uniref:sugar ABC transporter substrate-binding protein n=1 Tax=Nocardioides immobilis TaxID=2049295 RepID=UPI0015F9DA8B|nr:substrate-binding domain-containing protein [Nocardioides immobilis]